MFFWIKQALRALFPRQEGTKPWVGMNAELPADRPPGRSQPETGLEASTSGTASGPKEASTLGRGLGGYPHPNLPGRFFGYSGPGSRLHVIRELTLSEEAALCGVRVPKGNQRLRFRLGNDESKLCKNCFRLAKKGVR